MTLAKYSLLFVLVYGSVVGQQMSHPVMLSRDDAFSAPHTFIAFPETLRVLAAMIQFQEDTDARTSGNGRFDLSASADPIIDAPPRNQQYFRDHLTFVENYYRKASKGKQIVQATVVSQVITLGRTMESYSPPRNGPNTTIGNLAVDSWRAVDSLGLVADFSAYDCFIVFHAGVGRDIDLVSILGYDPTPFDIPSLYLGLNAFRSFFGQTYDGIPVNGGAYRITNSLIIPETSSRVLPGLTGDVLLELGINGLLCASVGNHLGLPDLFDTNTGRSGIGRFGLMDGQAIFSFFGVFPPEPSAWEKYWLGWIEPITLEAGEHPITLPAVALSDTVYRVPISAQEYYLIENRNRDPLGNGQTVTSVFNGVTTTRTFGKDTSGFSSSSISALSGVITDVEDLDWSVPGGVTSTGEFFDGGVLVWHIDEAIIAEGLAGNGINSNPARRGVDVEEADGSQDIGQEYGFLTPGSGSEDGTPLDFWFAGNPAPVFRNEFTQTSYPNSMSNSGGNSHVTISNFSARGPQMTATVRVGDENIKPLLDFPKRVQERLTFPSLSVEEVNADGSPDLVIATSGEALQAPSVLGNGALPFPGFSKLYGWTVIGTPAFTDMAANGLFAVSNQLSSRFVGAPAIKDFDGTGSPVITIGQNDVSGSVLGFRLTDTNADSLADLIFATAVSGFVAGSPVPADDLIGIGGTGGLLHAYTLTNAVALQVTGDASVGVTRNTGANSFIFAASNGAIGVTDEGATSVVVGRNLAFSPAGPAAVGIVGPTTRLRSVVAGLEGSILLLDDQLQTMPGFPVYTGDSILTSPALADVDGDGLRDIIVFSANRIHVYNYAGASLDHFPISVPSTEHITSYPIVADVDGDESVEVIAVTQDGLVVAYDKTGRMAPGFPLQSGTGKHSLAVFDVPGGSLSNVEIGLAVASSETGSLMAWTTGSTRVPYEAAKVRPWPQYQKDAQHSGLAVETLSGTPLSNSFFPENRAYNWPNPVYDGRTFIRYFVKDDASVNIKIFDLAGDMVTEFSGPGIGGVDNEVAWIVGEVQSGVYFARIEANGAGGNGVAVVKMAIVK
ncbi:MAG: FG-GAP-like repeat-containing protein [Bacteroidota bacterium]